MGDSAGGDQRRQCGAAEGERVRPGVATGAGEASSCNTKSFQTPGYSQIKMLCDPVRDGGSEEASSLQPWQIYSGLFLGFWAFSAFFNHFLATALLCLGFGAAGDQLTRYMYTLGSSMAGNKGTAGEVGTLLDLARQEALLHEEIVEEEEEDELPPPPVPARRDDIAERLGGVTEKLQQLTQERGDGPTEL